MTDFDNPETYEPGDQAAVDFETLVINQLRKCQKYLNKPAMDGYRGSAQLEGTNHPQISTNMWAEKWIHGTNQRANSCVETLHDMMKPYADEDYQERLEDIKEDAVEKLTKFINEKKDRVEKKDNLTWHKAFYGWWTTRRTRPLIRRRFKALLRLCERRSIIGDTPGVTQTS